MLEDTHLCEGEISDVMLMRECVCGGKKSELAPRKLVDDQTAIIREANPTWGNPCRELQITTSRTDMHRMTQHIHITLHNRNCRITLKRCIALSLLHAENCERNS